MPQKTLRGWHMREEFIFIVKADELRKWKGSMEEPEREWRDARHAVFRRPTAHENYSKSLLTYALTVDASKMSSIDSQLKPHCSIFLIKGIENVSAVFLLFLQMDVFNAKHCQQLTLYWLICSDPLGTQQAKPSHSSVKYDQTLSHRVCLPPHIIREGAFFGYILSTPKSVNSFFKKPESFPPDSLWMPTSVSF